jgi:hypothetical protein
MARRTRSPIHEQAKVNAADSRIDGPLLRLTGRMQSAECVLQAAMEKLAAAEQRLSERPRTKRSGRRPAWYSAAVRRERQAGTALDKIYKAIARARACTRSGLGIKVRVLAKLYGEVLDQGPDQSDMVSVMIHSVLKDVSG